MNQISKIKPSLLSTSVICLLCTLAIAGCSRSDNTNKKAKNEKKTDQTSQQATKQDEKANQLCADPNQHQAIFEDVRSVLAQRSQAVIDQNPQAGNLNLDNASLTDTLKQITFGMQDAKALSTSDNIITCQASLNINLPNQTLFNATQFYNKNNQSLPELLEAKNIRLNNNQLTSDNFTYLVKDEKAKDIESHIVGQPEAVEVIADITASATLNQALTNPLNDKIATPKINATPRPKVAPTPKPATPKLTETKLAETKETETKETKEAEEAKTSETKVSGNNKQTKATSESVDASLATYHANLEKLRKAKPAKAEKPKAEAKTEAKPVAVEKPEKTTAVKTETTKAATTTKQETATKTSSTKVETTKTATVKSETTKAEVAKAETTKPSASKPKAETSVAPKTASSEKTEIIIIENASETY